jgi:hypothetical protein
MTMERKATKILIVFVVIFISCKNYREMQNSIYGNWVDTDKGNFIVQIDSSTNMLTIDYTALGGKVFNAKYSMSQNNEIKSDILPKGAKIEFDKKGNIRFYPLDKTYTKDIESIYAFTFRKK